MHWLKQRSLTRNWIQTESLLLSSEDAEEKLANAEKARLLVVSDSHGSPEILSAILRQFGAVADALVFCGDGSDDLLGILSDSDRPELWGRIPKLIAFAQGNGDNSTGTLVQDVRKTVKIPVQVEFFVAGKKILVTHGHRYNVYLGTDILKAAAEADGATIAFYGHTHIANAKAESAPYLFNPGSCALPRGGLPHTFAFFEVSREKPLEYRYFEIFWGETGEIDFRPYTPPTDEVSLFW